MSPLTRRFHIPSALRHSTLRIDGAHAQGLLDGGALLVPAVVSMFGRWNWWLPAGAARLLRVRPSPEPIAESA